MIAILKHELRLYFHSLTAYVFGAFLLAFVGFGSMMYNLRAGISNFEYVLSFSNIIFMFIIPILTMRVIAEERKQKTDQLLYSLPVSTSQIILGKYLAVLILFLIPVAIIGIYPLLLSLYGKVHLLTAYSCLFAYCVMGAALIAVGVFISCLTENLGFAAGIGVAVIALNKYSLTLTQSVTATSQGSAIALFILAGGLGLLVYYLTKNSNLGYVIGLGLMAAVVAVFLFAPELLEGLIPKLMSKVSLFDRFEIFVNGVFDLSVIVYYTSIIVFFLFLSVQSLEKRRYN